MSDLQPPQYAGFGRVPLPPSYPPPSPPSSRGFLLLVMLIACIGFGALLAWGRWEHDQRTKLSTANRQVQDAYTFVLAKKSDIAGFLTDPRTRFFRLGGSGPAAGLKTVVAWQEETRTGLIVGDAMWLPPDHSKYVLWRVGPDSARESCLEFRPDSGMTTRQFVCRNPTPGKTDSFTISVEEGQPKRPGQVVYEVR